MTALQNPVPVKELGKLWLQIKCLNGTLIDVKQSNPALVGSETGCKFVQRRGFPEIIMPGALRNDFYLTLMNGEFEKSVKSNRSVQVEISVRYQNKVIPGLIALGEMNAFESYFRSTVYYMERSPRWMELIKMKIPVEEFKKCHLLFTYRHRSATQNKDRQEKEFAFSFLPLKGLVQKLKILTLNNVILAAKF